MKTDLSSWLDDFFASYYRRRPVNATFIGVHDYDDALPDYSENGVSDLLSEMRALRARAPRNEDSLDLRLALGFLEIQEWECQSPHFFWGNPSAYTGEAVFSILSLLLRDFAPLDVRLKAAQARLEAIPTLLAEGRRNIREAPAAWTERAIRECRGALLLLSSGIDPFRTETAERARVAFADFKTYLESTLLFRQKQNVACGEEAFDLLLEKGHFLDVDARAIESRAREALQESELRRHTPVPVSSDARYDELWEECRKTAVRKNLVTWPENPLRFVPQPPWVREAAPYLYFLYYRSPSPLDRLPVDDYFLPVHGVGPHPHARWAQGCPAQPPDEAVVKLNHVVHHAGLGHHVQNAFAARATTRIGQIAGVDCASRIALFCGGTMTEGWACYATDLMEEAGFLTPREQVAQAQSRRRQAVRAIVDVKLHRGEWSLETAADFCRVELGASPEAARAEAVKASLFPGTASMYLLGCEGIHQLRRDLRISEDGLRAFHDRLLSFGSVPVALIRQP